MSKNKTMHSYGENQIWRVIKIIQRNITTIFLWRKLDVLNLINLWDKLVGNISISNTVQYFLMEKQKLIHFLWGKYVVNLFWRKQMPLFHVKKYKGFTCE